MEIPAPDLMSLLSIPALNLDWIASKLASNSDFVIVAAKVVVKASVIVRS
jgi:hypothetical protein